MAKYFNSTTGLVEEIGNPSLNPDLIKGKTLVSDTTPLGYPQTYNPTTPTIITPASLEPISGLPYVNPNQSMFSLPNEPEPLTATTQETQQSDLIKQLQGLTNETIGKSAYQTEQETARGIPELQKTYQDLSLQLKDITTQAQNQNLQLEKQISGGGTLTAGSADFLNKQQNEVNRQATIKANGIASLLAATQGNLTYAQSLADKAVAAKYDPITEKINALTANLNLILKDPATTLAEKNRAQAQLDIQTKAKEANDLAKTNATEVWNVATSAASYIANFTPTPDYPTASVALDKISKAKTKEEALRIATETGLVKTTTGGADVAEFKAFFPNVDISTPQGQQQFLNWKARMAAAGRTTDPLKTVDYANATQFLADNPNVPYDELFNGIIQNTNLTGQEANAFLVSKGKTKDTGVNVVEKMKEAFQQSKDLGFTRQQVLDQFKKDNGIDMPSNLITELDKIFPLIKESKWYNPFSWFYYGIKSYGVSKKRSYLSLSKIE